MTSPDPFARGRRVRVVGVGRTGMGAVPGPSCLAPHVPQCRYNLRDGGAVTEVSRWDPGHIHCGSGSLTPPVLGAVAEWLAFNAFIRRAVGRRGRLSLAPRGGLERGGDESPLEGRRVALSRVPGGALERGGVHPAGLRGTLERGGDHSAGSRGMRMGRTLDFFESFPFFRMGCRPWAFVGPVALTGVCVLKRS